MPFQTKNDRLSCPQNEGMRLFSRPHFEALILGNLEPLKIKTSFWGFDPCLWYVSSPHCEDLILTKSPFSTPHFEALILGNLEPLKIKTSFWGLEPIKATKCRFDRDLTALLCGHFGHSLATAPSAHFEHSVRHLQREKGRPETRPNSPWFAPPPRIPAARIKTPHRAFLGAHARACRHYVG